LDSSLLLELLFELFLELIFELLFELFLNHFRINPAIIGHNYSVREPAAPLLIPAVPY